MVVFTCNHCGDSVKKPSVVKHYATKCRGNPIFLTCMDCQKDFKDKEHDGHTKCISEAERYSGKDYVAKPGQNKGQKKQDNWIETIRSLSTNKDKVDPKLRNVFSRLKSFENIPRKKAKFQNFVTNSFKIQMSIAMKVWDVLENELQELKMKNGANENKENEIEKSDSQQQSENLENNDKADVGKKPSKRKKDSQNNLECANLETGEPIKKKKKKNKTEKTNDQKEDSKYNSDNKIKNIENLTFDESDTVVVTNGVTKKNKKKNKLVEMDSNENINGDTFENGVKNKKSKKNKIVDKDTITNGTAHIIENEEPIKKKKKTDENIEISNHEISNNKFDWFLYINKCAADGMNVSKLKDKVLKKYKKQNPDGEITNKVEKTFKKYLKKSGLLIEDDIVKIDS
ncbi:uncharacterized protein C16C10.8 [Condylostylus longicornis]|uniref:uncharacterized protein C16C10.8 n=1 Tax=Condylostylus longicornis TaxID=2530218 RepID=UPI00244E5AC2|nr:uncharacterized protein C16C10.8 [Condylostylus longicornis]